MKNKRIPDYMKDISNVTCKRCRGDCKLKDVECLYHMMKIAAKMSDKYLEAMGETNTK